MKSKITLATLLLATTAMFAQTFPTEKIIDSGPDDKRIKFVILGDGYLASQQTKFISDAKVIANALFTKSPYREYKPYINIYAVKVPSNAEGAAKDPKSPIDNYFGSSFNVEGTDRCLFALKDQLVMKVASDNVPGYHQIMVLVNDSKYGGCGDDNYCTLSTNAQSGEIAIHESGHTYGGLADEYWFQFSDQPNQSSTNSQSAIKWSKWWGVNGIGAYNYEGAGSQYYRPHQNCEMKVLDAQFCNVCRDVFVSKYHKSVNMTESYTPTDLNQTMPANGSIDFSVTLLAPIPNTLSFKWELNGQPFKKMVKNVTVKESDLIPAQENKLVMSVKDTTSFIRVDHYKSIIWETVEWKINFGTSGINTTSNFYKAGIDIYPNPVANERFTAVVYAGNDYNNASLWLVDMTGKRVPLQQNINLFHGDNTFSLQTPSNLATGIYHIQLEVNGTTIATQALVKE